jgi:hypothetical protein
MENELLYFLLGFYILFSIGASLSVLRLSESKSCLFWIIMLLFSPIVTPIMLGYDFFPKSR